MVKIPFTNIYIGPKSPDTVEMRECGYFYESHTILHYENIIKINM